MTGPPQVGDPPAPPAPAAERALGAATLAFLFVAPFSGSAGSRATSLIVAFAALLAMRRVLADRARAFPPAVAITGAVWAALAFASLAWSVDPAYTLGELRGEILYGALALVVFFCAAEPRRWPGWWIALGAGSLAVLAGQGLEALAGRPFSRHPLDGGPGSWSTHLVLLAPVLLVMGAPRPWGFEKSRLALLAATVALAAAAWRTENRMVWVALAAQLGCVFLLWRHVLPGPRERPSGLPAVLLVAAAALVLAFVASVAERSEKKYHDAEVATASLERDLRPRLWGAALQEARAAPWLGHGFGREILAGTFLRHTPASGHPAIRHGHNTFLNVLVGLGAAGLAAFAALLGALAWTYARLLREPRARLLGVLGLTLLAGFAVKNLTDDFFYRHNAVVFWALNGMLLGMAFRRERAP